MKQSEYEKLDFETKLYFANKAIRTLLFISLVELIIIIILL